jgi:hypothetical protein
MGMMTVSIRISNSNDLPFYLQVDPWADLYTVKKGQSIEIQADSDTNEPAFSLQEYQDTRILTLCHSSEYFILRNGKRVRRTEYPTDEGS